MAALATALGLICGCGTGARPRVYPDKPDPHAAERAMELYDTNKDGILDANELEKVPGLKAAMRQVDLNKDGKISADEISARIDSWAASKCGRMGISCKVRHSEKPLAGANVKFVPEPFLGSGMKTYEGTTDDNGVAMLFVAGSSDRGVSPGFYRVEISKTGESIPAKYNTETQLGQEVANDAAGIVSGAMLRIDLKY
jgi:hypothetical protein